ncbi:MAG: DegV family protein [Roseburia sp.]|nr:DegV family protein [Roseburia sp.]MCM1098574.1 DegV family protein [Ruminococcus flavefaciens]
MSVRIVIDSASDITKERADELHLDFMPLKTIFGEEEYLDGITITHRGFYEKLIECGTIPSTSQVTPYEFEAKFREISEAGDTAVVITLSSLLSGTCQSAAMAAESYRDRIFLVDSLNLSLGIQNLILYAVRLRDQGLSAEEIAGKLEEVKGKIVVLAVFDTLEYLKQGGRISKSAAWAGTMLSIKPVISVINGEVAILGKARGSKNGNNMLIQNISQSGGVDFSMPYCLGYSGLDDTLLQKYIRDSAALWEGKTDHLPISTIGAVIGTHAGPGAIGVSFFHL